MEKDIQESHDVPCYLFIYNGDKNGRKNEADKHGRHWLCNDCHKKYEEQLNNQLRLFALEFSKRWFRQ